MGLIVLLVFGAVLGWLASIVMRTENQQGVFLNIGVGVAGALLGAMAVADGGITAGISVTSLLVAFIGALVLVGVVNLVRHGSAH
ncbi:MAG: GlsB/YeaQ/YmgE family stress response membrane protein [Sphingomonadales bacterium]|nr:GlsB/YeaQ/YmgE family stress response membrane protein [Sphingomonadales bacterium]MDE2567910.1 GlsB/YeaQ/YmgE family stress response membrane protein [Sphingomonadales bacterium]